LWSCVADLGKWISFQLRAYQAPGTSEADAAVLPGASLRQMYKAPLPGR
jgi:hypothetical protein